MRALLRAKGYDYLLTELAVLIAWILNKNHVTLPQCANI